MMRNLNLAGHWRSFVLFAYDAASALLVAAVLALGLVTPAYAYVDPSVMTYAIQAFAGIAVALSAVLGVALRRTRKKIFKLLKIDENAHKEVEGDVHRVSGGAAAASSNGMPSHAAGTPSRGAHGGAPVRKPGPKWPVRLGLALLVCAFAVYTVAVVAPFEMVASNGTSLLFGVDDIWQPVVLAAVVVTVVAALLLSALRGKGFTAALLVVFSLGLAAYAQVMFLNSSLPTADGQAVTWTDYRIDMAVGLAVWALIIAVPLAISHWKPGLMRGIACLLAGALIVVQSVGVASLVVNLPSSSGSSSGATDGEVYGWDSPENGYLTTKVTKDGLYEVSPKSNVIVFVLDMTDVRLMNEVWGQDPDLFSEMTGFTYYSSATGSMVPTRYGVPYLLTGEQPQVGEKFSTYLNQRYDRSALLPSIEKAGYSIGVYTDTDGFEYLSSKQAATVAERTINIKSDLDVAIDPAGAVETLWKAAAYRDLPWALKPFFWFYTDDLNNGMASKDASGDDTVYTINDPAWYADLQKTHLSATDDGQVGAFRFIHLNGAHWPYSYDADGNDVGQGNSTEAEQIKGSVRMVSEYLRQLKELGLYDSATIMITADHGKWDTEMPWQTPSNAIMLYKPAGTSEQSSQPIVRSNAPVGHANVAATLVSAVGGDSSALGTRIEDVTNAPATRYFWATTSDGKHDQEIVEFAINGNPLDFKNWSPTGNVWDAQE